MVIKNNFIALIWGLTLFLYLGFLGWHENWRGPLSAAEIDFYMARVNAAENVSPEQRQNLYDFMVSDTGEAFLMFNLVAYHDGDVADPLTGAPTPPPLLIQEYFLPFIGKVLRRGGYPAFMGNVVGGYIEAWATPPNPGWSDAAMIRYRSRRDLLALATDPTFADGHVYKQAALASTYALPVEGQGGMFLSPRIWVAFLLAGLAALTHIIFLTLRIKNDR